MEPQEFDLDELKNADVITLAEAGSADESDTAARAFESVKDHLSPQLRPRLERLLDGATPAGRVYAATLLELIDPEVGREAREHPADDDSPPKIDREDERQRTTVADYVAAHHIG